MDTLNIVSHLKCCNKRNYGELAGHLTSADVGRRDLIERFKCCGEIGR
jgi:hypothetical protein